MIQILTILLFFRSFPQEGLITMHCHQDAPRITQPWPKAVHVAKRPLFLIREARVFLIRVALLPCPLLPFSFRL